MTDDSTTVKLWSLLAAFLVFFTLVMSANDWHATNESRERTNNQNISLVECIKTGATPTDCRLLIFGLN